MAYIVFGQELPAEVFEPRQGPARLPANLHLVGRSIAKIAVGIALMPLPEVIASQSIYVQRAFYLALLVLVLFGLTMMMLSYLVSRDLAYYGAIGRAVMGASQIMVLFAGALRELGRNN